MATLSFSSHNQRDTIRLMIELLTAKNYKSLRDLEVPLQPLTVLVGPNAAGKSNILDCLSFISELSVKGGEAVGARKGFAELVWGGEMAKLVSVGVEGLLPPPLKGDKFSYRIVLEAKLGDWEILEEHLDIGEKAVLQKDRQQVNVRTAGGQMVTAGGPPKTPLLIAAKSPEYPGVYAFARFLEGWKFYQFHADRMIEPQPVAKQTQLRPDGSNVATVLHWLFSEEQGVFAKLEELLRTAMPELDRLFSPLTEDGKTYLAWREKHIPSRIPSWALSEGSVRLVAILLALMVPQPPSLVTFEAPDSQLHPGLMEYLADILQMGADRTQVIITTHSPFLLDKLPPESLLIVTKEAGETRVEPATKTRGLKKALKTLGLGELWYSGHFDKVP